MLDSFPHTLKQFGLYADARTLMDLLKLAEQGVIDSLGSLHDAGRHLVCKGRRDFGPYTLAFWEHFLGIDFRNHPTVDGAIRNAPAFEHWLQQQTDTGIAEGLVDWRSLIDRFLNEVMSSRLGEHLRREIDAREHLLHDNPDLEDRPGADPDGPPRPSDTMIDYSQIPMEELLERMQRVADQQKSKHSGGGHWIGSHGHSPYGHSGSGLHGIRVGGAGHAGSARKVLGDPGFFPVDLDAPLNDDTLDAALQALKDLQEMHPDRRLNVPETVEQAGRNAGIVIPCFQKEQEDRIKVMLVLDNGGSSMWAHVHVVQQLFSKMKRRFTQDLCSFYFHNAVYAQVYEDEARRKPLPLRKLLDYNPDYRVFIVGDAYMAAHEMLAPFGAIEYREESPVPSIQQLRELKDHFPYLCWLNPTPERYWARTVAPFVQQVMPMYPLTVRGLTDAIRGFESITHF
jgi:uncharacterized protein with von Willebrand factor type A (vWA) domain